MQAHSQRCGAHHCAACAADLWPQQAGTFTQQVGTVYSGIPMKRHHARLHQCWHGTCRRAGAADRLLFSCSVVTHNIAKKPSATLLLPRDVKTAQPNPPSKAHMLSGSCTCRHIPAPAPPPRVHPPPASGLGPYGACCLNSAKQAKHAMHSVCQTLLAYTQQPLRCTTMSTCNTARCPMPAQNRSHP